MGRPIVFYAWASTRTDEKKKLMVFERKIILRRIFGPKKNTENNEYERITDAESKELFNETDIVGVLKSRRLSWARHVWRAKDRSVNEVTMWKPDRKRPIGRPRQEWWSDRVGEDLKLLGIRDGETRASDREAWRCVVEVAISGDESKWPGKSQKKKQKKKINI